MIITCIIGNGEKWMDSKLHFKFPKKAEKFTLLQKISIWDQIYSCLYTGSESSTDERLALHYQKLRKLLNFLNKICNLFEVILLAEKKAIVEPELKG